MQKSWFSERKNAATVDKGALVYKKHEVIYNYELLDIVGKGTYGQVMKVRDVVSGDHYALKVMRTAYEIWTGVPNEIQVLEALNEADKEKKYFGSICEWFVYKGIVSIVFPLYGCNLYQLMEKNNFNPVFSLEEVRTILKQLFEALEFLHRLGCIHSDIKPDNIVFLNSGEFTDVQPESGLGICGVKNTNIRLIDFGKTVSNRKPRKGVVCALLYRPPEILLRFPYYQSLDVWCVAQTAFFLYSGNSLFHGREEYQILHGIDKVLGPFPRACLAQSKMFQHYKEQINTYIGSLGTFWGPTMDYRPLSEYQRHQDNDTNLLFDLLSQMLIIEQADRFKMKDAVNHPFFQMIT